MPEPPGSSVLRTSGMVRFAFVSLVLAVAACNNPVFDSASCGTIAAQTQQLVATLRSCRADSDCVVYPMTACGLGGECGAAISSGAKAQLDGLINEWVRDCPNEDHDCQACSSTPSAARCQDGVYIYINKNY